MDAKASAAKVAAGSAKPAAPRPADAAADAAADDDLDLDLNEIGRIVVRTSNPLFVDSYKDNRQTGSIVLVDEMTNSTVAAGMII